VSAPEPPPPVLPFRKRRGVQLAAYLAYLAAGTAGIWFGISQWHI